MIKQFFQEMYGLRHKERYLIYKGSGGLFHNISALSKAIRIAEQQNRKLVVDMMQHRAFPFAFSTFFTLNMEHSEDYSILKKCDSREIEKIRKAKAREFKKRKLNFGDKIIVYASGNRCPIDKRIKVKQEIMEKLKAERHINEPFLAVHFRNTDRKNDISLFIEKIKKVCVKQKIKTLYVASDDFHAYDKMKNQLGDMKLIRNVVPEKDLKNLHYHSEDKYRQIYESLIDIYFILQSDFFIPSYNSGYSMGIVNMIKRDIYLFPEFSSRTKIIN